MKLQLVCVPVDLKDPDSTTSSENVISNIMDCAGPVGFDGWPFHRYVTSAFAEHINNKKLKATKLNFLFIQSPVCFFYGRNIRYGKRSKFRAMACMFAKLLKFNMLSLAMRMYVRNFDITAVRPRPGAVPPSVFTGKIIARLYCMHVQQSQTPASPR